MKKTLIGMLAVGAMLCCTLNVQAVPQIDRSSYAAPHAEFGAGQSPNSGSIDDDCAAGGFPLGMLGRFMNVSADTTGLLNDFGCDPACPAPCGAGCGFYTIGAADGIATFTVPATGTWRFATCGGVVFDSALAVREGGACPGASCVGQDDDSCAGCNPPYEARLTVSLTAGTTYYLIVDGYSGEGNGDMLITGPCAGAVDCQDGTFCNGAELCTAGMCAAGANPCTGSTPFCNEATDTCFGCNTDADCEDGIFCNGDNTCNAGTCGPQSGNPCSAVQVCDEANDVCNNLPPCQTFRNSDFVLPGNFFPQCTNANCNTSPTGDYSNADEVELEKHSSYIVNSYQIYTQGRDPLTVAGCNNNGFGPIGPPAPIGTPYVVNAALFTVEPGSCFPDQLIPGSECVGQGFISGPGTPANVITGNLAVPVAVPDGVDDLKCFDGVATFSTPCTTDADCLLTEVCVDSDISQCGVDFYIVMNSNVDSVGPSIGCTTLIGGPGLKDEAGIAPDDVMVFATCDANGQWTGWRYVLAGPGGTNPCPVNRGNWRGVYVCTEETGACCNPTAGTCSVETADDCAAAGGTYLGDIQVDGSGGCDDGVDTDGDGSRDECDLCDNDPTKTAPGQCGCGIPDTDSDNDGTANCNDGCPNDPAKTAPGQCGCGNPDTDTDNDGTADCLDGCPDDPNKTEPGICGCGVAETGDTDGDGVSDCVDQCPGVDDAVFAPGCVGAIPTVSEWGMVVLAPLLLAGAKVYFGRRPVQA